MGIYRIHRILNNLKILGSMHCLQIVSSSVEPQCLRINKNNVSTILSRYFASEPNNEVDEYNCVDGLNVEKKKKVREVRITLLTPDDSMTVVSIENAQKLATRRNLKLIQIKDIDPGTGRAVYKLMSNSEYIEYESKEQQENVQPVEKRDEIHEKKKLKPEKLIQISCKSEIHDFQFKLKNVQKLLLKNHPVKVILSFDGKKSDSYVKAIENALKDVATVNKVQKSMCIVFKLSPTLQQV